MKARLMVLAAGLAVAAAAWPAPAQQPGVTARDGKLYRDGKVYRGVGVNYCDLFEELLYNPDNTRTLDGLRFLGQKHIPFVRFWCCGFGPASWKPYLDDKEDYFRRLDKVVRTAEESGVGLIPSLFWCDTTVPLLVGEFRESIGDPDSKTWEFMRTYIGEVVTRYKDSPAIWGWECGNEWNLAFDLPNGLEFVPQHTAKDGTPLPPDKRDLVTWQIGQKAFQLFAREVRKHDPYRFITTGSSFPRTSAFHFVNYPQDPWGEDSADEAFIAFKQQNPDPIDVACVHSYGVAGTISSYGGVKAEAPGLLKVAKEYSERLGKPLFVGEFAGHDGHHEVPMDLFREGQRKYLQAVLEARIDLAAYWVFDYTADRKGIGLVRKDNEYAWVLDDIVDCNTRIEAELAAAR